MIRRPPRSTLFPLHDALPICLFECFLLLFLDSIWVCWLMGVHQLFFPLVGEANEHVLARALQALRVIRDKDVFIRSEEHTSELQSQSNLVCRLLLDKKKPKII